MKILWNIELGVVHNPWNYECNFIEYNGNLFYIFSVNNGKTRLKHNRGNRIFIYKINPNTGDHVKYSIDIIDNEKIMISKEWYYIINNGLIIFVGKYLKVAEEGIIVLDDAMEETSIDKNIPYEYVFENKIIKYNREKTLYCMDKKNRRKIWEFALTGYLKTKIEYKNGDIIFGTSGIIETGSILYVIELESGVIKWNNNNVKAYHYSWHNDTIIISDKKGIMKKINPNKNITLDSLKIKYGKLSDFSPIKIYDGKIFTIVYDTLDNGRIVCIKI